MIAVALKLLPPDSKYLSILDWEGIKLNIQTAGIICGSLCDRKLVKDYWQRPGGNVIEEYVNASTEPGSALIMRPTSGS